MRRESHTPYGYQKLLVYKKAEELLNACTKYTAHFLSHSSHSHHYKTLRALADQMDRSARSVKQNIVEGWERNSTKEYHQFLGFSLGACAELEEDCNDIIKGVYKGLKGEEKGIEWVEKQPFYPLDPRLSLLAQLKLRCKEINFLLQKLQKSLEGKMQEGTKIIQPDARHDEWLKAQIEAQGLVRLEDGRIVEK